MADWPLFLPNPELGFSGRTDSPIDATEMDSGEIRQRPVRRGRRYRLTASFVTDGLGVALFHSWVKFKIRDGVDPIEFVDGLPVIGGDFIAVETFMQGSQYGVALKEGPDTWEISFRLEAFVFDWSRPFYVVDNQPFLAVDDQLFVVKGW